MNWTTQEENKVKKMTRHQVRKMSLKQLWIAAEYEKFSVDDLITRAQELVTGQELTAILDHINSYEDETPKAGNWYKSPPTVRY